METHDPLAVHPDNAIVWHDGRLYLLDQRYLPEDAGFLACDNAGAVAQAIASMVVRGAPAIGIAAAYGVVLAARDAFEHHGVDWRDHVERDLERLAASRPTAVNFFWALKRMRGAMDGLGSGDPAADLLAEAPRHPRRGSRRQSPHGGPGGSTDRGHHQRHHPLQRRGPGHRRLRHGPRGHPQRPRRGPYPPVYADETRPWMQGSRLTAWELHQSRHPGHPPDRRRRRQPHGDRREVGWVIVGSDRIAANGDVANKIGTYMLAVLARHHGVRFMVAAPTSTIDMAVASGAEIPIEERDRTPRSWPAAGAPWPPWAWMPATRSSTSPRPVSSMPSSRSAG